MYIEPIEGHWVRLRCAEEKDAEFTLSIRNDPEKTRFISRLNNTLAGQREWLKKYSLSDDGCLLVIENKSGESLGTISFFNIDYDVNICEVGRFISYGNSLENIETSILLMDFLFEVKKFVKLIVYVYKENKPIINYNKRFGYEIVQETVIENSCGDNAVGVKLELWPEKYYAQVNSFKNLLNEWKEKYPYSK